MLEKRGSGDNLEEAFVRSSGLPRSRSAGHGCFVAPECLRPRRSGTPGMARQSSSCRIRSWESSAGRRKASSIPRTGTRKCRRVENPARPRCARPPSEAVAAAHRQTQPSSEDSRARATGNCPAGPRRTATVSRSRRIGTSVVGRQLAIMVLSAASSPRIRCRVDGIQVAVARAGLGAYVGIPT